MCSSALCLDHFQKAKSSRELLEELDNVRICKWYLLSLGSLLLFPLPPLPPSLPPFPLSSSLLPPGHKAANCSPATEYLPREELR